MKIGQAVQPAMLIHNAFAGTAVHSRRAHVVFIAVDAVRPGIIALQLHAGPEMRVEFRNLKLKRLP